MKRVVSALTVVLLVVSLSGCGTIGRIFSGGAGGAGNLKKNSVQALVTTTRMAKLLVTSAAVLADKGAITEQQWRKIASASIRIGNGLQAWSDALRANQDTSEFQSAVDQALAVLDALMPEPDKHTAAPTSSPTSSNVLPFPVQIYEPASMMMMTGSIDVSVLIRPNSLRHQSVVVQGGI